MDITFDITAVCVGFIILTLTIVIPHIIHERRIKQIRRSNLPEWMRDHV